MDLEFRVSSGLFSECLFGTRHTNFSSCTFPLGVESVFVPFVQVENRAVSERNLQTSVLSVVKISHLRPVLSVASTVAVVAVSVNHAPEEHRPLFTAKGGPALGLLPTCLPGLPCSCRSPRCFAVLISWPCHSSSKLPFLLPDAKAAQLLSRHSAFP